MVNITELSTEEYYDEMGLAEFDNLVKSLDTNLEIINQTDRLGKSSLLSQNRKKTDSDTLEQDIKTSCPACSLPVTAKDCRLFVSGLVYHDKCFTCHLCDKKFGASVPYIEKADTDRKYYYCEVCYDQKFGIRCEGCKEPIISGSVLHVLHKSYHPEHFTCSKCNKHLFDGKGTKVNYFEKQGQPFCEDCCK